jgi:hypothetical protein
VSTAVEDPDDDDGLPTTIDLDAFRKVAEAAAAMHTALSQDMSRGLTQVGKSIANMQKQMGDVMVRMTEVRRKHRADVVRRIPRRPDLRDG